MSTLDLTLLLNGVDRGAVDPARASLRMVLVQGEALRLPGSRMRVSVLSGTAWITQTGRDTLLPSGAFFELSAASDRAVISSIGSLPLCFEMR
ncbi:MAG: hypothetical protein ABSG21_18480 [Spirochaetia bacterium]|jgi:hypothetical protein